MAAAHVTHRELSQPITGADEPNARAKGVALIQLSSHEYPAGLLHSYTDASTPQHGYNAGKPVYRDGDRER